MSDLAELGPLGRSNVQVRRTGRNDIRPDACSALTVLREESFKTFEDHFLNLRLRSGLQITTKTALEIAAKLTIGLFEKVYEQLDPMRLGEYQRALLIAHDYGTRLATDNVKGEALDQLIAIYPSHEFIIDRGEAAELFCTVRLGWPAEARLAAIIRPMALASLRKQDGAEIQFLSHETTRKTSLSKETTMARASRTGEVPPPAGAGGGPPLERLGRNPLAPRQSRITLPATVSKTKQTPIRLRRKPPCP